MRLVALNEEAWSISRREKIVRSNLEPPKQAARVHSWKTMLDFLKNEACCSLFAKREDDPLKNGLWTRGRLQIDLTGSLKSRIDSDNEIDYLDELTEKDLLSASKDELHEVWIPELLFFRDSYVRYLTIAAYALGATPPDGLFKFPEIAEAPDQEYVRDFS